MRPPPSRGHGRSAARNSALGLAPSPPGLATSDELSEQARRGRRRIEPRGVEFLALPRVLAMMIMLPCLTVLADVVGMLGGVAVAWIITAVVP